MGFVKRFLKRLIGPTRPQGRALTTERSGVLGLQRLPIRSLDFFDVPELSPAQKAAMVLSCLPNDLSKRVTDSLGPVALHRIVREQQRLRRPEPGLCAFILSEYLGLPPTGAEGLGALEECLKTYVDKELEVVVSELQALLRMDAEVADLENFWGAFFFQDLLPHHKVAVILWLTNTLNDPSLELSFGPEGSIYIRSARPMLLQLKMMTKLRVVREFLEISLTAKPEPSAEKEFGRLILALNTVQSADEAKFFTTVRECWPEVNVNPLIVRMFQKKS